MCRIDSVLDNNPMAYCCSHRSHAINLEKLQGIHQWSKGHHVHGPAAEPVSHWHEDQACLGGAKHWSYGHGKISQAMPRSLGTQTRHRRSCMHGHMKDLRCHRHATCQGRAIIVKGSTPYNTGNLQSRLLSCQA